VGGRKEWGGARWEAGGGEERGDWAWEDEGRKGGREKEEGEGGRGRGEVERWIGGEDEGWRVRRGGRTRGRTGREEGNREGGREGSRGKGRDGAGEQNRKRKKGVQDGYMALSDTHYPAVTRLLVAIYTTANETRLGQLSSTPRNGDSRP